MGVEAINEAAMCAARFLDRVDALTDEEKQRWGDGTGTKQTAAVRRASMELTRALAEMRRGPQ